MENLNLDLMGVQEMKALELEETNGGWLMALIFGYIILQACLNPEAHIKAFKEGWAKAE